MGKVTHVIEVHMTITTYIVKVRMAMMAKIVNVWCGYVLRCQISYDD